MPRPRLTETTYRLNYRRGRWFVDYTDPTTGITRSVSTGTADKAAAKIFLDQWLAGRGQPAPPPIPLIVDILAGYEAARTGKVQSLKALKRCVRTITRHIGNLEPPMLATDAYRKTRAKEKVSNGTIRREVGVLRAAFNWAIREKWLTRAPFVESTPAGAPRDRWLTHDEIDRLIAAAHRFHLKLFIVLAYHTAARAGAILELTWDRVDFEHLRISYDRPGRQQSKKRRTTVPINPVALAILQTAYEARTTDHVIEWAGKPIGDIKNGFALACERAEIADCSPHILRHTAATHMVMAGVRLAEIARFLGDSERMVEKVYGKHSPDYLRDAAMALAGKLGPREVARSVKA